MNLIEFDRIINLIEFDLLINFISKKIDLIENRSILYRYILKIDIVELIKSLKSESRLIDDRIRISDSIRRRLFDSDSLIALAYFKLAIFIIVYFEA